MRFLQLSFWLRSARLWRLLTLKLAAAKGEQNMAVHRILAGKQRKRLSPALYLDRCAQRRHTIAICGEREGIDGLGNKGNADNLPRM